MRSEDAIRWYGKKVLIDLATTKSHGKVGQVIHGFIIDSSYGQAPRVELFGSNGNTVVDLDWEDGLHNLYEDPLIFNMR